MIDFLLILKSALGANFVYITNLPYSTCQLQNKEYLILLIHWPLPRKQILSEHTVTYSCKTKLCHINFEQFLLEHPVHQSLQCGYKTTGDYLGTLKSVHTIQQQ